MNDPHLMVTLCQSKTRWEGIILRHLAPFARSAILLLLMITLSGCLTERLAEVTLVTEDGLRITRVRVATDGAIALDVEPTIWKYGGRELRKRRRFLLGSRETILMYRKFISPDRASDSIPPVHPSEHLEIAPNYTLLNPYRTSTWEGLIWELVPARILARDVSDSDLGRNFQNGVLEYIPTESIPYSLNDVDITISFRTRAAGRKRITHEWFYYPLIVPTVLIDVAMAIVSLPVLIPYTLWVYSDQ